MCNQYRNTGFKQLDKRSLIYINIPSVTEYILSTKMEHSPWIGLICFCFKVRSQNKFGETRKLENDSYSAAKEEMEWKLAVRKKSRQNSTKCGRLGCYALNNQLNNEVNQEK